MLPWIQESDHWVFSIPLVFLEIEVPLAMVFRAILEPLCWHLPLTIWPGWDFIFEDVFCLLASFERTGTKLPCLLGILALALKLWMITHCSTCASLIQSFLGPCGALDLFLTCGNCTTLCSSRFSFGMPFGETQTSLPSAWLKGL